MKRTGLYMGARFISAGGRAQVLTLRPYGLRFLHLLVRGASGPVNIRRVYVVEQVYPFELKGSFECDDPVFNALWNMGWRTLQVCAEDAYTDTPFRERGLYAGDMLPQMALTLIYSGDLRLVRRSLDLFQDMYADQFQPETPVHPDEINLLEDYPLLTLEALAWYTDATNDTAYARKLLPSYEYLLNRQRQKQNEAGRILNESVFIDWLPMEKRLVENTAYHALLVRSFEQLSRLRLRLGDSESARIASETARALTHSLTLNYWDEEAGAFRDGWKNGQPLNSHFPISSGWPFLFGLTDSLQSVAVIEHITHKLQQIGEEDRKRLTEPYGSFYLLSALYLANKPGDAEQFIRKYFGPMILRHDDTAWENFGDRGIGTLSHAWSGHPAFFFSTQILGVQVGWPGPFSPNRVVIAPHSESINWANGAVPHPKGIIRVNWQVVGSRLLLEYDAPEELAVDLAPRGRLARLELWVNGQPAKNGQ